MRPKLFAVKTPAQACDIAGVILLALLLVAGAIYSAHLGGQIRFTDEQDFLTLSHNMLQGIGYSLDNEHLTATRPPGYPFLLAGLESLGGGFFVFRLMQFLLLGVTIYLITLLAPGRRLFAGILIVTTLVLAYPILFYTSGTLYSQPFSAALFILALVLLLDSPRTWWRNALTGFVFGFLVLTVPTFLMTTAITLSAAWLLKCIRLRDGVIIVLFAALPLIGWGARNAVYLHHFVPVSSNSGGNFLAGNNPEAQAGDSAVTPTMEQYYGTAAKLNLDEFQANTYYWTEAMNWVKSHPGDAFGLYCEKVINFFSFTNRYSPASKRELSGGMEAVQAASYSLLLGLVFWRLWDVRRFPLLPREKLFLAIYILSAFASAIFLTRIRLRIPYDYLLIAIAAFHISHYLEAWLAPRKSVAKPEAKSPVLLA